MCVFINMYDYVDSNNELLASSSSNFIHLLTDDDYLSG